MEHALCAGRCTLAVVTRLWLYGLAAAGELSRLSPGKQGPFLPFFLEGLVDGPFHYVERSGQANEMAPTTRAVATVARAPRSNNLHLFSTFLRRHLVSLSSLNDWSTFLTQDRCSLSFSLRRTAFLCISAARSRCASEIKSSTFFPQSRCSLSFSLGRATFCCISSLQFRLASKSITTSFSLTGCHWACAAFCPS